MVHVMKILPLRNFSYNASVCVSPGNIGLTAIHALSFGCPIITHNNFAEQMPEFESIKPSKTGYFYQQGDIADLKDKIRKVISADESTRDRNPRRSIQGNRHEMEY